MVQKLPEVLRRMEAAEAAHKNANPGTELPVQNMETIVEEYAAKYNSLAVAQGAAYAVKVSEAYSAAPAEDGEDKRRKIPCRFYAAGKCTWGAKCRYAHDGKPAQAQQTGQIHWRSNRQPKTVLSPAEAEVYALSVGVKDSRLMGWVLEELGVLVHWPMSVCTDSAGAKSFKEDSCPTSKLRGSFDYREDWVEELRQADEIKIQKVTDQDNISDVFTKCKATYKFKQRIQQIRDMSEI